MSSAFLEAIHADPWSEDLVDLAELNAHASVAIETSVSRLRELARSQPSALRSTSMVVLGPPGAGKTHLFARLRRRFGPRAVFVHIRPLVHAELSVRFVLGETVRQLSYSTHSLKQIDALVGSLLAHLDGADVSFPSAFLSEYEALDEGTREERLEQALERVLERWQEADESYLRRLLRAPFAKPAEQRALLAWLSGRDCDVSQLVRIGATSSLADELCPAALKTLSAVAALGAPIVLVFDQLENLVEPGGSNGRLLAYGNLVAELADSMRGLMMVHMALDTEWSRAIEPAFNLSQRSRLLMQRQTLALPTPTQREELLRLWIERLEEREAPFPWPLGERRLARLRDEAGLTPRMLLVEFRTALQGEPEAEAEDPSVGLAAEWEQRLLAAHKLLDEASEQRTLVDAARLVDGLLACTRFVPSLSLKPSPPKDPAQLTLDRAGELRKVAVLQHGSHKSLGGALAKLTTLSSQHPVTAIRERAHELPPTWKDTREKRRKLLATRGAQWIDLDRENAARLLALDELLQCARSGDVTDARGQPVSEDSVVAWASAHLDPGGWSIARELSEGRVAPEVADEPSRPVTRPEREVSPSNVTRPGHALILLEKLRLASLDRIVREVTRIDAQATRATVIDELASSDGVKWFGRSIVCARVVS
jgi:hypothetical protein